MADLFVKRDCHFSPCRRYRYMLRIVWDPSAFRLRLVGSTLRASAAAQIVCYVHPSPLLCRSLVYPCRSARQAF